MIDNKVDCMRVAKKFGVDYWDGDRRYGYGGYQYIPGRWKLVAELLISNYKLGPGSSVLDVGCGKGYLLHEMLLLEPKLEVVGFDISEYCLTKATELVRKRLFVHGAEEKYPFYDNSFDLVISLGALHNLTLPSLFFALSEVERVGKQGYVMVESYRSELELFNLQCWALTCQSFFNKEEWIWMFEEIGYTGDYEFIYFE